MGRFLYYMSSPRFPISNRQNRQKQILRVIFTGVAGGVSVYWLASQSDISGLLTGLFALALVAGLALLLWQTRRLARQQKLAAEYRVEGGVLSKTQRGRSYLNLPLRDIRTARLDIFWSHREVVLETRQGVFTLPDLRQPEVFLNWASAHIPGLTILEERNHARAGWPWWFWVSLLPGALLAGGWLLEYFRLVWVFPLLFLNLFLSLGFFRLYLTRRGEKQKFEQFRFLWVVSFIFFVLALWQFSEVLRQSGKTPAFFQNKSQNPPKAPAPAAKKKPPLL